MNANDALHAAPISVQDEMIAHLKQRYPVIDYAFCGYGTASHFPNCYTIPGKDRVRSAAARQHHFNVMWARIIERMAPKFGFPFAADVVFLDEALSWSNEAVHNAERPTAVFQGNEKTTVFDIAPGFSIEDGRVVNFEIFRRVSNAEVMETYKDSIASANKATQPTAEQVADLASELAKNVDLCRAYLSEFRGDYRFLIALHGASTGIEIAKEGAAIAVRTVPNVPAGHDLVLRTRYAYLRRALSHPYGHEIIFVGSGAIFEYTDRKRVDEQLHRELGILLRKREKPPVSRFGTQSRLAWLVKTGIKRLLGRQEQDIYSLADWTRYAASR